MAASRSAARSAAGNERGSPASTSSRSCCIERVAVGVRSTSSVRRNSSSRPSRSASRPPRRRLRRRSRQVVCRSADSSSRGGPSDDDTQLLGHASIEAADFARVRRCTQVPCCASSATWSRTWSSISRRPPSGRRTPPPASCGGAAAAQPMWRSPPPAPGARRGSSGASPTTSWAQQLVDALEDEGVDARVQRGPGRTGTVVVLVEPGGERTMLPDRAAALELGSIDRSWLEGVTWLHAPAYSLCAEPIGTSTIAAAQHVRAVVGSDQCRRVIRIARALVRGGSVPGAAGVAGARGRPRQP